MKKLGISPLEVIVIVVILAFVVVVGIPLGLHRLSEVAEFWRSL